MLAIIPQTGILKISNIKLFKDTSYGAAFPVQIHAVQLLLDVLSYSIGWLTNPDNF